MSAGTKVYEITKVRVTSSTELVAEVGERVIEVDASLTSLTLTVCTYSGSGDLRIVVVDATNTISVALQSGETCNGDAGPFTLSNIGDCLHLHPGSAEWKNANPSIAVS